MLGRGQEQAEHQQVRPPVRAVDPQQAGDQHPDRLGCQVMQVGRVLAQQREQMPAGQQVLDRGRRAAARVSQVKVTGAPPTKSADHMRPGSPTMRPRPAYVDDSGYDARALLQQSVSKTSSRHAHDARIGTSARALRQLELPADDDRLLGRGPAAAGIRDSRAGSTRCPGAGRAGSASGPGRGRRRTPRRPPRRGPARAAARRRRAGSAASSPTARRRAARRRVRSPAAGARTRRRSCPRDRRFHRRAWPPPTARMSRLVLLNR